jgi:hypothetical protein
MLKCASRTQPSQKAACRRRGTAFGTARLTAIPFRFRAQSVQSIMGATEKRQSSILFSITFTVPVGSIDFRADK